MLVIAGVVRVDQSEPTVVIRRCLQPRNEPGKEHNLAPFIKKY